MNEQFKSWKLSIERLLSGAGVDWHEAARLAAEIAGKASDATLRQAAAQALPVLRNAAHGTSDHGVEQGAKRRLGVMADVLQDLTAPRFGTRSAAPKPLTAEQRARKLLDLPPGTQLTVTEIRQAFRRAAKSLHPDAGGSEQAFLELIAAQDVLMHPKARWD
jgi:hypothetical protein